MNALAILPDGKTLISGSSDGTALVWDFTGHARDKGQPTKDLTAEELEMQWQILHGSDAALAYEAMLKLAAHPGQVLAKLQKELQPVSAVDPKAVNQWIADLDDTKLAVRTKAALELKKAGDAAWPLLRKALDDPRSLEMQRRIRQLLGNQDDPLLPFPERLKLIRSLELLERLNTPGAVKLAESLAAGAPEAWMTQEAKMMLKRQQ